MSLAKYKFNLFLRDFKKYIAPSIRNSFCSNAAASVQSKENADSETITKSIATDNKDRLKKLAEYRFVYPEFLSNPKFEYRHKVKDKLERMDMLKRRSALNIPEFYVGSILAVTASDPYAPGKKKRFVGICIHRTYFGLRATFTLRNIVDGNGVEIMYELYNPLILSIEVLKLEKRLDEELFYLRDALPEYSTFDFDMEQEFRNEGDPVPVNPLKVKLKPFPWHAKWNQRMNLKGIESVVENVPPERKQKDRRAQKPWEKYDLMREYRMSVTEEEQEEIWKDVDMHRKEHPVLQKVWKKKLLKVQPK